MTQRTVEPTQRFSKRNPCPICGGYDRLPQGRGVRCWGFMGSDGNYAHCTRDDFAGPLPQEPRSGTYAHRMQGYCACGVRHGEAATMPEPITLIKKNGNGRVSSHETRYLITEIDGEPIEHVRVESNGKKTFRWERGGKSGLGGIACADLPLYGVEEIGDATEIIWVEGEKSRDALQPIAQKLGYAVIGTVTGASSCPSDTALAQVPNLPNLLWPDADHAGEQHMARIAERLKAMGRSVSRIVWDDAREKDDAADFVARGGDEHTFHVLGSAPFEEVGADSPPFPIDAFPDTVRRYIEECAASLPVPPEMIAMPLLAEFGGVIGNRAYITPKRGWAEYACLYVMVVAGPGKNKTAALKHARWPMKQLQRSAMQRYQEAKRDYERAKAAWKGEDKDTRGDEPTPPTLRHLFTTDGTLESISAMLQTTPGLCYSSDELTTWIKRMNQYRQGGDREQYMSIWSGDQIKVDRKTGGSVYVETPVVSVSGGVQPDVVPTLHSPGKVRDGFVERLLPIMPDIPVKTWRREDAVSTDAYARIADLFRAVDSLPPLDEGSERVGGIPLGIGIQLSREADAVWGRWYDQNNAAAAEVGGFLGGFYTKLEAHVARFALCLHIMANPPDLSIGVMEAHRCNATQRMITRQTMNAAIELGEYCRGQIHTFLPLLLSGATPSTYLDRGKIGLVARLERLIARKGRKVEGLNLGSCKCLNTKEVLQGLRVSKDELMNELDTYNDLSTILMTSTKGSTKPSTLFCLSVPEKVEE
jgi:hypothetical protein